MILFASCAALRPEDVLDGWLYLGKGGALESLAAALGRPPLPLGDRLHRQAKRLRRPFLDLVAALGRPHESNAAWWAGTLPWKDPAASDLFLLCCYQAVCLELASSGARLAVAIEDPWLLSQLAESLSGRPEASFRGLTTLAPRRVQAALGGLGRRIKWAGRMLLSRARQEWSSRGRRPRLDAARQALLYSHLMPRSLEASGWTDHYLTGLDAELAGAGFSVLRLTDPNVTGFEAALAERPALVPPILYSSLSGLLGALVAFPPAVADARLEGVSIGLLLRREWWHDLSRSGRCAFLFLRHCLDRVFSAGRFEALVFPWENQPQERMLVLCARRAGVRTVGYQHTTIPELMLHFFPGKGEAEWAPWPDRLLASGAYPLERLCREGLPARRLLLGGSRRYRPLTTAPATASPDVLALLPIDPAQSARLLAALGRARKAAPGGFRLVLKPHPTVTLSAEDAAQAEIAEGTLEQALKRCGAVVFSGTTAGIEAWLGGHPVLRFRAEALLDVDPADALPDSELPTAGDWDLPEKLARLRAHPAPANARARKTLESFFAPLDKAAWLSAIEGTA